MKKNHNKFKNFESALDKILTVSHEELKKREEKWNSEKGKKRPEKAKPSSLSHEEVEKD